MTCSTSAVAVCCSSGLVVERFAQLAVRSSTLAGLARLVEQARVLDRDHRLVGEGAQQADLLVAEAGRRLAVT
jgi:hypothetical protein